MKILYEIKIVIFKYVENPISLALANRAWYTIFHDPHARSEWLLNKYGRAHALFHAVRLGRNFLTLDVIKCLMAKKAILSRYFVQRLMLQCGGCDGRLLELRNTLNVNQEDFKRLNSSQKHHWGYDLSVDVFIYILEEAIRLYESDVYIKGNDFDLLHLLTASSSMISLSSERIQVDIEQIKDLILNKKLIPFPPSTREHGYENVHQLNILARAIVLYPDLVNLWKQIGYHEICKDTNSLVIRGVYLLLFPSNTDQRNWVCPDENVIFKKLKIFIDLGFKLDNQSIRAVIYLFRDRISEIGEVILKSFYLICKDK
ncbi:hypothetical protein RhiirA5_379778 [Rhizophagus irregularis]|uniref:F-box domain-containing protein n=1 Tax=Rhizophagus irregularis TaxID=588596 RepID=A0A2N0PAU7_9GLOM|nr:hypothetical protein RhiirA5_380974 [Rhizophagus irregularis]PKC03938.1 hypothetical protein RhiirA5_379778 [Rhizophagus irregularis]